jgi:hypothetical protein
LSVAASRNPAAARPSLRVHPIARAVEEFVDDVVARRHEARGEDGDDERPDARPGGDIRLVEHGQHHAEQHEGVLEPVVDTRDLHVRPDSGAEAAFKRDGQGHG